jgi:3-methylcrotonyl-CoA carboxylase alpha subunit
VVRSRSFAQADLDTALIPREQAVLFHQEPVGLPLAAACRGRAHAARRTRLEAQRPVQPPRRLARLRRGERRFAFEFGGQPHQAELPTCTTARCAGLVNGDSAGRCLSRAAAMPSRCSSPASGCWHASTRSGETDHVFTPRGATQIVVIDLLAHAGEGEAEGGRLTAPMPGKVVSFAVKAGDAVKKGQALAVMEAMKMEHTIAAPADGTIAELLYAPGDQVAEGAELLKLAD